MGALAATGQRLDDVARVRYEDAFLIGDLLTTRITLLVGEPKAGKSLLSVGICRALLNGEAEFLGQRVLRGCDSIVVGLTDDGAEEELRERFTDAEAARVRIFSMHNAGFLDTDYWEGLRDDLLADPPELLVVDNLLGLLGSGEDIADSPTATRIIEGLRKISEAGIPVLAVTHTPKGAVEGTSVASSPIGGRAIAGGARGIIVLRKSDRHGRTIKTAINRAGEDLDLPVSVDKADDDREVPIWSIRPRSAAEKPTSKRKRPAESMDAIAIAVDQILVEQPEARSMSALGAAYGPQVGVNAQKLRKTLPTMIKQDSTGALVRRAAAGGT